MKMRVVVGTIFAVGLLVAQEAEEVKEDLGVISPKRGIVLVRPDRTDFEYFKVEVTPHYTLSNLFTLNYTNELLTVNELRALPDGYYILGVRSVFRDGTESEISLSSFYLAKERTRPPRVYGVQILDKPSDEVTLLHVLRQRSADLRQQSPPPPLPNGTNALYEPTPPIGTTNANQMIQHYNRAGRRNEQ